MGFRATQYWLTSWSLATRVGLAFMRRAHVGGAGEECSVDDEQRRTRVRARAMRLGVVSDLIAHPRRQLESSAVGELRLETAGDAEQNVSLLAPMISAIAARVFNEADTNR